MFFVIYYLKFIIFLSKNFHFDLDFCYLKKFDTVTWILHKTRAIMSQKPRVIACDTISWFACSNADKLSFLSVSFINFYTKEFKSK